MPVRSCLPRLFAALALCSFFAATQAADSGWPGWNDDDLTRLKAQALLQTLNASLLAGGSATRVLQQWCDDHQLAPRARMRAQRVAGAAPGPDEEIRTRLQVDTATPLAYRRVELHCGDTLLSEADNWYVPSRLSREMNQRLEQSDIPFGVVVAATGFSRRTLSDTLLWTPLAEGRDMRLATQTQKSPLTIPEHVLRIRALLIARDGTPISLVEENYRRDLFAFPLGQSRAIKNRCPGAAACSGSSRPPSAR